MIETSADCHLDKSTPCGLYAAVMAEVDGTHFWEVMLVNHMHPPLLSRGALAIAVLYKTSILHVISICDPKENTVVEKAYCAFSSLSLHRNNGIMIFRDVQL